jgi:hypothetical protein
MISEPSSFAKNPAADGQPMEGSVHPPRDSHEPVHLVSEPLLWVARGIWFIANIPISRPCCTRVQCRPRARVRRYMAEAPSIVW